MTDRVISRALAGNWPTLIPALGGAGIGACIGPDPLIVSSDEEPQRDARLIVQTLLPTAAPYLVSSQGGRPARIGFGMADAAFGHALIAELIRPAPHPAFGEPATRSLYDRAKKVAATNAPVLIEGETGSGKEGLARLIHSASSRASRPFVAINCAALPETMAEAMLFGHERGSFTGADRAGEGLFRAADGGTLLLDEVAELPLALQAKLLRALQEGEVLPVGATRPVPVDARIVAAANRDLAADVATGRFRADLYWRLNVMRLELPPLRKRRLDVRAIAAAMLIGLAKAGVDFAWPTVDALDRLLAHDWPGNARELCNVLQRALLTAEGGVIREDDIQLDTPRAQPASLTEAARTSQADIIRRTLAANDGHRARTAEMLGVSERTLRYRLAEMRLAA